MIGSGPWGVGTPQHRHRDPKKLPLRERRNSKLSMGHGDTAEKTPVASPAMNVASVLKAGAGLFFVVGDVETKRAAADHSGKR